MAGPYGWRSPVHLVVGAPILADDVRAILADLEDKFRKISGADLYKTAGKFQLDADLDLMGHRLLGASNVATGIVNIKSHGVVADGSDESKSIQAALDSIANAGYRIALFPAGTYGYGTRIIVPPAMSIWGSGGRTILKPLASAEESVVGLACSGTGFVVRDLRIIGDTDDRSRSGVTLSGASDVIIENVVGKDLRSTVELSGGCEAIGLRNVNGTECLNIVKASDVTGLVYEGGSHTYADQESLLLSDVTGFAIVGLAVHGAKRNAGFSATGCANGMVIGSFIRNGRQGILMKSCTSVSVHSHVINSCWVDNPDPAKYAGIELNSCDACIVEASTSICNDANSRQTFGLEVAGGSDNIIACNVLGPNNGESGDYSDNGYEPEKGLRNTGNGLEFGNFLVNI